MHPTKYLLPLLFLILFSTEASSQITSNDKKNIKSHLLKRINELRVEKGVGELKLEEKLKKPADVHSFYMSKVNELSHSQRNPKFNTIEKRIEHFSPLQFDIYGENILLSKRVRLPISKKSAIKIADEMFTSWKNSPGHYANMIEKEFNATNFGFEITQDQQIYATNVFGRLGVKIKNQLSANQFGLEEDVEGSCFAAPYYHSNILVNVGNAVRIEGDEVILYYYDKNNFFTLFSESNDGIAVDLIEEAQFSCGQSNQLDISPIHDGVLLKPIYRDQLRKINTAKNDYRLIASIGKIPPHLVGKTLTLSVLLIKNGIVCKRVIPSFVPSASYPLKPLYPYLDNPENVNALENYQLESLTLPFHFNTNESLPIELPEIENKDIEVVSVEIKSYSSIEGSESNNEQLHNKRAAVIKKYLSDQLKVKPNVFKIDTKENWEVFYFQLKYYFLDSLLKLPKEELRQIASEKRIKNIPWDSLLYDQRKSTAIIFFKSKNTDKLEEANDLNALRYGILNGDTAIAQKALYEIYTSNHLNPLEFFDEAIFESIIKKKEFVKNTAAILSKYYSSNLKKSIQFLNTWLIDADKLDDETKFNLINLYTIVNNKLLDKWDLSSKRFANVINPKYVSDASKRFSSNELMLNLHLTFIKYFGQINDSQNISKSFDFISKYFLSRVLEAEDAIALSKFYNRWSMYQLTNDYLLSKIDEEKVNEDLVFLLLQTLNHFNEEEDMNDYDDVYRKGFELNKFRWCTWVDGNIQLLRDRKLKKIYCEKCK